MNKIEQILAVINKGEEITYPEIRQRVASKFYRNKMSEKDLNSLKAQVAKMSTKLMLNRRTDTPKRIYSLNMDKDDYKAGVRPKHYSKSNRTGWQVACYYEGQLISSRNVTYSKEQIKYIENCQRLVPNITIEIYDKKDTVPKLDIRSQKIVPLPKQKRIHSPLERVNRKNPIEWFGAMPVYRAEQLVKQEFGLSTYRDVSREQMIELFNKHAKI